MVGLLINNRPELPIAIAGIVKQGAVASVLNTKVRGTALAHCLSAISPLLMIVGEELTDAFDAVRNEAKEVLFVADDTRPHRRRATAIYGARWRAIRTAIQPVPRACGSKILAFIY